jgi:hypothetical protein
MCIRRQAEQHDHKEQKAVLHRGHRSLLVQNSIASAICSAQRSLDALTLGRERPGASKTVAGQHRAAGAV